MNKQFRILLFLRVVYGTTRFIHGVILREKNGGDYKAQFYNTISRYKVRKCNGKTKRCELRMTNHRSLEFRPKATSIVLPRRDSRIRHFRNQHGFSLLRLAYGH